MSKISVDDFNEEKECIYKEEKYSVRDNGAVFRHSREGKIKRKDDCKWTFGKPDNKGYLFIAKAQVHRIVATAFHGEPPSENHVVDHMDTNRQNNRPENLRWLTRIDNVMKNPITKKKLESILGPFEEYESSAEFFEVLRKLPPNSLPQNYDWMRTVSKEEAAACKTWGERYIKNNKTSSNVPMGEWVFSKNNTIPKTTEKERIIFENNDHSKFDDLVGNVFQKVKEETGLSREELSSKTKKTKYLRARVYAAKLLRTEMYLSDERISKLIGVSKSMVNSYLNHTDSYLRRKNSDSVTYTQNKLIETKFKKSEIFITYESLTSNAVQQNWKTPCEFPCCPEDKGTDPIITYAKRLTEGSTFYRNKYGEAKVLECIVCDKPKSILVISEKNGEVKPWGLTKITHEDGLYLHTSIGTFFDRIGAQKYFTLEQGLEWTGGQVFDDMC